MDQIKCVSLGYSKQIAGVKILYANGMFFPNSTKHKICTISHLLAFIELFRENEGRKEAKNKRGE